MNKKAKAALAMGVCSGFLFNVSPIYANEGDYQLVYEDEKSLVSLLKNEFSEDLGKLKIKEIKGDKVTLESNDYEVIVNNLNYDDDKEQEIQISLYDRAVCEVLEKLGFPDYSEETIAVDVNVVDETAPEIESDDVVETNVDEKVNFDDVVTVTDNKDSSVDYTIDGDIDYTKDGSYEVTVNATDESGNESSKEITVKVTDSNFYQKIADAALSQIGVNQDCTMLVTNSLAAVGINFHGDPSEYASLGEWTSNPVPGDICIYDGHVAIYVGNGQAVHGGWLGYTTIQSTVECTNSFIGYIHVNH